MTGKEAIKDSLRLSRMVTDMLLVDLADADLLARSSPTANHLAWQIGHLISAENSLAGSIPGAKMPPLPEGFSAKHNNDTAKSDDPAAFLSKAEYLRLYQQQRDGTLALLDQLSDADLDKPGPERMKEICPTVGSLLNLLSGHENMHMGQVTAVRRKLGKPNVF